MNDKRFVVEGDGIIYSIRLTDDEVRDLIRFGTIVSVFRLTVAGVQYADVDPITHDIVWKSVKEE